MPRVLQFEVPESLELFTQPETDQILHCAKTKRMELIHAGKLAVVVVAGKKLITGQSLRAYLAACAADPKPTGRTLCALQLNSRTAGKARV